jgi:ATP-dependent protease HslVU (ClpYQ) peptidase subunit
MVICLPISAVEQYLSLGELKPREIAGGICISTNDRIAIEELKSS